MSAPTPEATPPAAVQFWPMTDVGRVRDHNEDSFLVDKKLNLFIVADGMGGHAAGEVASQVASHTVREVLKGSADMLHQFEAGPGGGGPPSVLPGVASGGPPAASPRSPASPE